jgi:hypothetical protein
MIDNNKLIEKDFDRVIQQIEGVSRTRDDQE